MLMVAVIVALTTQVQTPRDEQQQTLTGSQRDNSAATRAVESMADDLHAINERQARDEAQRAKGDAPAWRDAIAPATWSNWILAILALVAAVVGIWTLRQLGRQTTAAVDSANAAKTSADAVMRAERAYVTMSRTSKLRFGDGPDGTIRFDLEVQNHGKTPANILGGGIKVTFSDLGHAPPEMSMDGALFPIPRCFLVPGHRMKEPVTFSRLERGMIMRAIQPLDVVGLGTDPEPPLELWLMGYVDYRDQFGDEHRGGFGRRFDRATEDLTFDQATAGLNYDRPLTEEERQRYKS